MCHPFCLLLLILGLAPALLLGQVDSTAAGRVSQGNLVRPLTVYQTRYRLRAGESTKVDVAPETLDFLLHAKTRHVEIAGKDERGIVVGPNRARDQILVAVSLAMKPGEYTLALSATTEAGERRDATLSITVDALTLVPANATQPPVILLNGWQGSTCSPSPASETFGNLADYLTENDGVPVVYWFDNCTVCPTCLIETLGSDLAQAIGSIKYDNGAPVLQVDLIAHSMGGLIVRSYLSGKQIPQGVFNPPNNPNVRKAIFIATPHLGSYQAGVANDLFLGNPQTDEMALGSQFLFDLATWNQFGDDLRGTDALAIVGDAVLGSKGDGIVSSTSASLRFAEPDVRTRIVDYCHMTFSLAEAVLTGCYDPGIAFIDSASHPTFQIVQSFLANTTAWETIGTSPSQDPYLSVSGGLLLASKNAGNQYYADLSSISAANASLTLKAGPSNSVASLFYNEWVPANTYDLAVWSGANETLAGALTATAGGGIATFFKQGPVIFSVRSLAISSLPGRIVQSGGTITISGLGFGQQCSGCQVLAVPPGSATGYLLPVSSWTNQAISASFLPATMPSLTIPGLVTIYVELSSSAWDSINIMAAAPASTIVVAPTSLRFSYTEGGTVPAAQSIQLTNNGGGALNWSATTSASWLSVAPASGIAPSTPSVLVSPAGLSAGTYTGSVQVSAAGASNSPVSVAVTLTVAPAAAVLAVSPQTLTFNYTVGGAVPAIQALSITNTGGALNWSAATSASWLSVVSASGAAPSTPSVRVSPAGLSAGTYTGSVQVSAAGASNSSVSVTVTLTVAPASAVLAVSPQTLMFNYAMGSATPAAQGVSINNGGGTLAWTASSSASWLTVSPAYGSTSSTLSVSMNPLGLIAGALNGTITISSPGIASQTLSVTLTVTSAPLTPAIVSVVNAASFLPGFAPIGWVTITGKNLSATSRTWTGSDIVNGQLPTALDGVSVTINNHPAFVYYISPGQLNVQAPSDSLAADQNVQVTVTTPNGSATATALERHIAPAMFMSDSTHVAAIHSDGTLVGPVGFIPGAASRPASPGETILLYMTGLGGDTSPVIPAGQIVTSPASMTDPVSVSIGGQSAIVQYAGLVSPGLYQLNVVVPAVANGDQTATVQVAGVASENTGVVTVQQ
jgi:uncharacterized protein (TIGR03437 family)